MSHLNKIYFLFRMDEDYTKWDLKYPNKNMNWFKTLIHCLRLPLLSVSFNQHLLGVRHVIKFGGNIVLSPTCSYKYYFLKRIGGDKCLANWYEISMISRDFIDIWFFGLQWKNFHTHKNIKLDTLKWRLLTLWDVVPSGKLLKYMLGPSSV